MFLSLNDSLFRRHSRIGHRDWFSIIGFRYPCWSWKLMGFIVICYATFGLLKPWVNFLSAARNPDTNDKTNIRFPESPTKENWAGLWEGMGIPNSAPLAFTIFYCTSHFNKMFNYIREISFIYLHILKFFSNSLTCFFSFIPFHVSDHLSQYQIILFPWLLSFF